MNEFELQILDWIQSTFKGEFLDTLMPIISMLGDGGIFWIATAVILICFKQTRKTGICIGLALLMGVIFGNLILKNVVHRIRPYDLNTSVDLLINELSDFSFPSGHTLASFEAATVIFIKNKRFGIFALILAILVAASRLYMYVHYPTDILAGIILGVTFGFISCYIIDKISIYLENRRSNMVIAE